MLHANVMQLMLACQKKSCKLLLGIQLKAKRQGSGTLTCAFCSYRIFFINNKKSNRVYFAARWKLVTMIKWELLRYITPLFTAASSTNPNFPSLFR